MEGFRALIMKTNRLQNLTLTFFYLLLLAVPAYWIIRGPVEPQKSLAEGRILKAFPMISFSDGTLLTNINSQNPEKKTSLSEEISVKVFQRNFEQAASDQFPFRFPGILVARAFDRTSITLAYLLLPNGAIPTDMQSGLYVMRDGSKLIAEPYTFSTNTKKQLDIKTEELKSLIETNPDIQFYLFYHQKLADSPYHPLNKYYKNADQGKTWKYFTSIVPDNLSISTMMLSGFDEDSYFYYHTDHHMSVKGTIYAYDQVYDMLAQGYPDISPKLNTDNILVFPNIDFLGSYARRSLYPIQADDFSVPITSQPDYQIYKNSEKFQFSLKDDYLAGVYTNLPYVNHYGFYYGNDPAPFIDFRSENGSNRSILVFGSSYSRPVLQLLAAHYKHVYYVDLRRNKDFSLHKFLKDHTVDDLVIFADHQILVDNSTWKITP